MKISGKAASALILIGLVCFVSGCGLKESAEKARVFGDRYMEMIKARDFQGTADLFDSTYFEGMSRTDWVERLVRNQKELGDLKSYQLYSFNLESRVGSGTICFISYEAQYANQKAFENLVLAKPDDDDKFKILSHELLIRR